MSLENWYQNPTPLPLALSCPQIPENDKIIIESFNYKRVN